MLGRNQWRQELTVQSQQQSCGRGLSRWHDVTNYQWVSRSRIQWEERQKRLEHVERDSRTVVNVIWATLCAVECRRALLLVHTVPHTLTQQKQSSFNRPNFYLPCIPNQKFIFEYWDTIWTHKTHMLLFIYSLEMLSSYLEFGSHLLIKKNKDKKKYLLLFPTF